MAELIYVADPMCSWCYAFGPELDEVRGEAGLSVRLVMGGLFVRDRRRKLDDELREYLRQTWTRVAGMSGRPVEFTLLDRASWTYDTELACRAVVWCRNNEPHAALDFFSAVQSAFYADNADVTNAATLSAIADRCDLDGDALLDALATDELATATLRDFDEANALGAEGFPLLLLDTGRERIPVATGYARAASVLRSLRAFQ